jgi:hypothetical protein
LISGSVKTVTVTGQMIPNLVIATLPSTGPDAGSGFISLHDLAGSTNAIVDVEGYYVSPF